MPRPSGYGVSYQRSCSNRGDCVIGVGFDTNRGTITRFLVDLQYTVTVLSRNFTLIARIDHNPTNPASHDILSEGLHVDVESKYARARKYWPQHAPLPSDLAVVIDASVDYLDENSDFFVDFYEGNHRPSNPPDWSP